MVRKIFGMVIAVVMLAQPLDLEACTSILVSRGASADGSTMVTYAADSHTLYGELYFLAAADHPKGTTRRVVEWDTGKYLGDIEEAAHTYQVIGNMNEHQLVIGETTFGGRSELKSQAGALIDYGSLIWITLQRAKTAREAIKVMGDLVERYGYYSSGESFSIADGNEVWIMELIGKGEGEKGAVWVARRIPEGYISAHANQARITTFPLNDAENCIYSEDVISFARSKGWFSGKDKNFSFSDTYAPVDFGAARFCDARAWSVLNQVAEGMDLYHDYIQGDITFKNGVATNRPPLWVKPTSKVSVEQVMNLMRDHFQGTPLDMTQDVGAGPFNLPYRWRGLTWDVDGQSYCHERAISTQQTAYSIVGQSRGDMPAAIGGILWFGLDDTYTTCYSPVYCSVESVPEEFREGNGDMLTWSDNSAFWIFNSVTNFCYLRYSDMVVDIQKVQGEIESRGVTFTKAIDKAALSLWEAGSQDLAKEFLTEFSTKRASEMVNKWRELGQYLMIKYKDGNIMKEENGSFKRSEYGIPVSPSQPGYPEWFRKAIVDQKGDHLKVR